MGSTIKKILATRRERYPNIVAWNKGLTKEYDERMLKNSENRKRLFKEGKIKNPFKGKTYEEVVGIERARIMKEMRSIHKKNRIVSKETKMKNKINRSKQITPTKDTSIEIKIQNFLKQLGLQFFTHQYIREIEHCYQCDILIPSMTYSHTINGGVSKETKR